MSDQDDTATSEGSEEESDLVKRLRTELKQQGAALSEEREGRTKLERQQAFRDAGVDPQKGPGKLLFENFDGPAEVDAVKAKAEEYGLSLGAPDPREDDEQEQAASEQERAAMSQMDQAAQGGSPDQLPNDPAEAARGAFDREMANTGSRKEAMAKSFNARMIAALEAQKGQRP